MMRLAIVALLSICLGWFLFAAMYHPHEHEGEDGADKSGLEGVMPGRPVVRRRVHGSVAPVVKPKGGALSWLPGGAAACRARSRFF